MFSGRSADGESGDINVASGQGSVGSGSVRVGSGAVTQTDAVSGDLLFASANSTSGRSGSVTISTGKLSAAQRLLLRYAYVC